MAKIKSFIEWLDYRIPIVETWDKHMGSYYAPKNFNFWYYFGVFSLIVLVMQLLSGIWLTMNYKPSTEDAFFSVEYIMRDVEWGWFMRYLHSTGASMFFVVVYLHMYRGILYGSYKEPRELLWLIGCCIYLVMMAMAFFGYMLPWGQMSYWGANVIISLFSSIPFIGEDVSQWIKGDFYVSDTTLNRFFAFHVIAFPLILLVLVFLHIIALHRVGSNNPDGIEIKKKKDSKGNPLDGIPFHPYYTVKDSFGLCIFLIIFFVILFYFPTFGGFFLEPPNFEQANYLKTPDHIAPVWYFNAYYAILRTVPSMFNSQFPATFVMIAAVVIWFFLPWLDRSKVKSIRYKGVLSKIALGIFTISFIALTILGSLPIEPIYVGLSKLFTILYFLFFLLMPIYTTIEKTKQEPERVN